MRKKIILFCIFAALTPLLYSQTPVVNAKKRTTTITINGNPNEAAWQFTNTVTKPIVGTPNNTVTYAVLWDDLYLYVAVKVTDANKFNDSSNPWDDDAIEIYVDADNNGGTSYGPNDRQFMKEWNSSSVWEKTNKTSGLTHAWTNITGGYAIEMRIAWSNMGIVTPVPGFTIGFDVANNDDDNGGARESQRMWAGDSNNWQYPQNFGDLVLVTTGDTQAPTVPTNLAANSITQSSLTLTWTASTDNVGVTGYDVFRNGTKINTSLVTSTTYNVSGLNAATAYQFYVQAKDAAGNTSANSNTINVTTPDTQAPTAPTNLAASSVTQTTLTLTWTASTDNVGVSGYDVYRDGTKLNTSLVTSTNYNVTGLTASTAYQFFVQVKDAAGNSTNSSTLNVTTPAPPDLEAPSAPANLAASNITQSSVTLNWDAATDNVAVTGYDVYRDGVKVNTSLVTTTTYNATGLLALVNYSFYVVARDAAGNSSANSNTVSVTTPDTQAPTIPSNLTATSITQTSMTLNWNASTDNIGVSGYDVYQDNVKINASLVTGTSYNVTGLSASSTYAFYIKAFDAAGNNSNSNTSNFTTLAPPDLEAPSAPSGLASSNLTSNSVTLAWTTSTDNVAVTGYDVYRNGTKINTSAVTTTTYNVTGLTPSTVYSFYVIAFDAAGNFSANSNTINLTTPAAPGCTGTGSINYQRWNNITGTTIASLTSNANYPNNPTTSGSFNSFEITTNSGDNYGMKVYGYICPPTTGNYTFWIASDDNGELWLSNGTNPSNKTRIAYHTQWTNSREWNKYATQKSAAITLTAGQLYYVEALMKEGGGGDNLAVGWAKPGQATTVPSEVIPGSQLLRTIPDSQAPTAPTNLAALNLGPTSFLLTWTAATDNIGITGYDVYRDGTKITASPVTGTSYNVTGLTQSTLYSFVVIAKDAAGNSSSPSTALSITTAPLTAASEVFTQRTIIANQRMPHDLVYGPDNNIWYTERFAGTVSLVNTTTGAKTVLLTLGSKMVRTGGQDGLMGLALHPQLLQGKPYVYISYSYESTSSTVRKLRIERYTYNSSTQTLEQPVTILENIPGSNDHNSARLAIGPDLKLYFTIGDMGAGQFDNINRTNNAQNLNVYEGKVLRLNTESVGGSWIPTDNPFGNAVYSLGHRNAQGLVWGNVNGTDILYSSEHGPYSDDEINIIQSGRNYGWPQVSGFCDGNYNGRTIGGFAVASEQANCVTLNAKEPLRSLFPSTNPPTGGDNMTWPSTGPSGTDFYGSNAIPGWQNSILIAQLKNGTVTRFKLSNDGTSIISDTIHYFRGIGRFRDVVVSPDGLRIYVACDSSGSTSGPTGGVTTTPPNPGSILEFTYQPQQGARGINELIVKSKIVENTIDKSIDVYPNPARSFIIVYNYQAGQNRTAELFDLGGRSVKRQALLTMASRLTINNIPNGLYVLRITDGKGKTIRTEKIIIQK
jgi:PQQ-dependent dehydrogenase (s-GDH family)